MAPWGEGEEDDSSETTPASWYRSESENDEEVFDIVVESEEADNQETSEPTELTASTV